MTIGPDALIPNPALAGFQRLIGTWRAEGSHAQMPDVTLHGRTSFEWAEGGAFLVIRSEIDDPRVPSGVSYVGSDDERGEFYMLYFDSRGISRMCDVGLNDDGFSWSRDFPGFAQHYDFTISADGQTMVSSGELCTDEHNWEPDLGLTYTRI